MLRRHNAAYFTHLRDELNKVIEAVEEAIEVAEQCGVHVEIVHFKCSGTDNWGKAATALAMIATPRRAASMSIAMPIRMRPDRTHSKICCRSGCSRAACRRCSERLAQPDMRQRIGADIARDGLNNWGRIPSWDCVQISISPHLPQYAGRTIAALAAERGADPIDVLCDYLIGDRGATRVLVTSISEEDIRTIVASPHALVGSDGNCVAPYGTVGKGMPHPRFYGTFPRILSHYVRDEHLLPLELAIHKMTGATARALKFHDRGLLKESFRADVVMFDPNDFVDRATYADPHRFPSGSRTGVIVNGTLVVEQATHTGALPGMVLRRDRNGAVG